MAKILDITFKENEKLFTEMQDLFNSIGEDALYMTHYELADSTDISPIDWKNFLTDPRVSILINEEFEMIKKSKVALMLRNVESNKNTGQAQLLNTLLNQTKKENKKEGPVFIYTQIPLNKEELQATNVRIEQ